MYLETHGDCSEVSWSLCLETQSPTTSTNGIFRSQTSKELSISVICKLQKTQILVLSELSCTKVDAWYQEPFSALMLTRSLWVEHYDAHCGSAKQDVVQRGPVKTFKNWSFPLWMDWAETVSVTTTRSIRSYQHSTALLLQSSYQEVIKTFKDTEAAFLTVSQSPLRGTYESQSQFKCL